jgi:YD repeat-containing protein
MRIVWTPKFRRVAVAAIAAWLAVGVLVVGRLYTPPACATGTPIHSAPIGDVGPIANSQGPDGGHVDPSTGVLLVTSTDLAVPGQAPLTLRRTYRTFHPMSRTFGRGSNYTYGVFLYSAKEYEEADLVLPSEALVHYVRVSPGTSWVDAVFRSTSSASAFAGSTLAWNGGGWDLRLANGTVLVFGERAPLQAIREANGAHVEIVRRDGDPNGNIVAVRSSDGRCIGLAYDGSGRITSAWDDTGRSMGYAYDPAGYLSRVSASSGAITEYRYDVDGRMTSVVDAHATSTMAASYDANGRVRVLTTMDGASVYAYVTDSAGRVTETEVTDPQGVTRQIWP